MWKKIKCGINDFFKPFKKRRNSCTGKFIKWLRKWMEEYKNKKIYKRIVTKAIVTQSTYLASSVCNAITNFIIVALQLISFFTTYEGAKYYMAEISPIAPLAFALAIQTGIVMYAVSFEQSNSNRFRKGILLLIFTFISIAFSYTGMWISSFSPIESYYNTYQSFSAQYTIAKNELIKENSSTEKVEQEINEFYGKVDNLLSLLDGKIVGYNQKISEVENIKSNSPSEITRSYNRYTNRNETTSRPSDASVEAARTLPTLQSERGEIENVKTMLLTAKGNAVKEDVLKYIYGDDSAIDPQYISTLISAYNSAAGKIGEREIDTTYIDDLQMTYINFEQIAELSLEEPEGFKNTYIAHKTSDDENSLKEKIKAFFMDHSSASEARVCLHQTQNCINKAYNELVVWNTENVITNLEELNKIVKEIHSYGDPNFQAVISLVNNKTFNKSLGILILAITIDGLTLLVGFWGKKKALNLLAASTEKELITNEEELIIMVSKALSSSQPFEKKEGCDFEKQCLDYVKQIKEKTRAFLSEFNISPWTNKFGYGQYAPLDILEANKDYTLLMTLLLQLNYLKIISVDDYQILQCHYNGISTKSVNSNNVEDTKYICLLRYRVNNFMVQNCTDSSLECYLSMFGSEKEIEENDNF